MSYGRHPDCVVDDDRPTPPQTESVAGRNARWDYYRAERIRKGRPVPRRVFQQYDITARAPRPPSVVWDPILDLHAARQRRYLIPEGAMRYGALLALAFSPVLLPADREPVALRAAA